MPSIITPWPEDTELQHLTYTGFAFLGFRKFKCKWEITTTVEDNGDQSVVEISSDDGMEVNSPRKQPTRKRQLVIHQ